MQRLVLSFRSTCYLGYVLYLSIQGEIVTIDRYAWHIKAVFISPFGRSVNRSAHFGRKRSPARTAAIDDDSAGFSDKIDMSDERQPSIVVGKLNQRIDCPR